MRISSLASTTKANRYGEIDGRWKGRIRDVVDMERKVHGVPGNNEKDVRP